MRRLLLLPSGSGLGAVRDTASRQALFHHGAATPPAAPELTGTKATAAFAQKEPAHFSHGPEPAASACGRSPGWSAGMLSTRVDGILDVTSAALRLTEDRGGLRGTLGGLARAHESRGHPCAGKTADGVITTAPPQKAAVRIRAGTTRELLGQHLPHSQSSTDVRRHHWGCRLRTCGEDRFCQDLRN
ncbi:uncharacterized protein LOC144334871 [Macaca mulatta]